MLWGQQWSKVVLKVSFNTSTKNPFWRHFSAAVFMLRPRVRGYSWHLRLESAKQMAAIPLPSDVTEWQMYCVFLCVCVCQGDVLHESGTNASMPRWQSPSPLAWCEGTVVSEPRSSSFITHRPHGGGKISAKTQSLLKHSILSLCHDREKYTWKATGSGNAIRKYIWFSISHL